MSWIERAYVGQKIICIHSNEPWVGHIEPPVFGGPGMGEICEIAEIEVHSDGVFFGLKNHAPDIDIYHTKWFKPVKDTITQVEALKRLCNPTPEVVA